MTRVSFTRDELRSFTGSTLPDLIDGGVRLLFVGINPGLRSVAVRGHFAPRGNRFYPALLRAGITDHLIDASAGLAAADRAHLLDRGIGITSLVARATASADELGPAELTEGARALAGRVRRFRPRVVAILGITAYRTAFGSPRAVLGRQPEDLAGSQLWVVPNPSGRNAHASLDVLAAAYREVALAAAVPVGPAPGVRPARPAASGATTDSGVPRAGVAASDSVIHVISPPNPGHAGR
jgi:double-stranded uracil-DNA glycosylase